MKIKDFCLNCMYRHAYNDEYSNCTTDNCAFCTGNCKSKDRKKRGHFSATCTHAPEDKKQLMDILNKLNA